MDTPREGSLETGSPSRDRLSPSVSRSLDSTSTATVRPGLATTRSSVATGATLRGEAWATPTRTVPVAWAPKRSSTTYVKVSVPVAPSEGV